MKRERKIYIRCGSMDVLKTNNGRTRQYYLHAIMRRPHFGPLVAYQHSEKVVNPTLQRISDFVLKLEWDECLP